MRTIVPVAGLAVALGVWIVLQFEFRSPISAPDSLDQNRESVEHFATQGDEPADRIATEIRESASGSIVDSDKEQWWRSSSAHGEFLLAFQAAIPDVREWDLETASPGGRSIMERNRLDAIEAANKFLPIEGEFAEVNGFQYEGKTFLLTLKGAISRGVQGRNLSYERFQSLPEERRAAFEREPWTKPAASFLSDWGEEGATHHFDPELEPLRRIQWKYIVERARIEADLRLLGHAASRARYATVGKEAERPPTDAESEYAPAEYMALWGELEELPLLFQLEIEAEAKRLGY